MHRQDSFYVHIPCALLVMTVAIVLRMERLEFGLLVLCITMVLATEYLNSALESLAKAVDQRHNQNLGDALDIASGAVLVASCGASAVGALLFLLQIVDLYRG
jgi:diacylglycerol kinase